VVSSSDIIERVPWAGLGGKERLKKAEGWMVAGIDK